MQKNFIPVILGGNLGSYSIARSFHEAYQVKSMVICTATTGPIKKSKFIIPIEVPDMKDPKILIQTLEDLEKKYPTMKILIGSGDWHVETIIDIRDSLGDSYMIPYVSKETFTKGTTKDSFYNLCESLGVPYPKTVILHKDYETLSLPFDYPIIIKPADTPAYSKAHFPGKKKIYFVHSKEEADRIIKAIFGSDYSENIIIQEYIEGDNESLGVVTCYRSFIDNEVKMISFGHVLLEDPTPSAIGNHLAIIDAYDEQICENIKKIVEALDFKGFSNFDVKYNVKTKQYVFFELNGRLGRSNYYITGNGFNPAPYYVKDLFKEPIDSNIAEGKPFLYTVVAKSLLKKRISKFSTVVDEYYKKGYIAHPLVYKADNGFYRFIYSRISSFNYYKKFKNFKENTF